MSPRNATEIGQRRSYKWRGQQYPSVTTLLKTWPMEWAIAYGAKHVAERAVFQHAELTERLADPAIYTDAALVRDLIERHNAALDRSTGLAAERDRLAATLESAEAAP